MVFFTCNHCGESLKKNKVDVHGFKCSRTISVSCMDCNKDFNGKTFKEHTQCITEQEKYSAKGFVPKPISNKGLEKQQTWVATVNSLISSTPNLQEDDAKLLDILSKFENIPRKKNKFENFLKNGIFRGNQECVNRVWVLIQQKFAETKPSDEAVKSKGTIEEAENTPPKTVSDAEDKQGQKLSKKERKALKKQGNNTVEVTESPVKNTKKSKKRKAEVTVDSAETSDLEMEIEKQNGDTSPSPNKKLKTENGFGVDTTTLTQSEKKKIKKQKQKQKKAEAVANNLSSPKKFDWQDAIVQILSSADKKQLTTKVLRKKVLAKYKVETGQPITDSIKAKFNRRANSATGVKVLKGIAVLS